MPNFSKRPTLSYVYIWQVQDYVNRLPVALSEITSVSFPQYNNSHIHQDGTSLHSTVAKMRHLLADVF